MYCDAQLKFSAAQAITAAAASTNKIDMSEARNIGVGRPLFVAVMIDTTFTHGGSCTNLNVYAYGDSTSTFTPDGSNLLTNIPPTAAAASGPYYGQIPPALVAATGAGYYRWLQLYYDPVGASLTAGAVTSYLVLDIAAFIPYANNYTIS